MKLDISVPRGTSFGLSEGPISDSIEEEEIRQATERVLETRVGSVSNVVVSFTVEVPGIGVADLDPLRLRKGEGITYRIAQ